MQPSPIVTLVRAGRERLERHGVPNALHNAEWMLSELFGCERADLYLHADTPIEPALVARFDEWIGRRCRREPLQYILGSIEFMSFRFAIVPGVFIPRFETELLVEWTERAMRSRGISGRGSVLDLCSGSGVIILSLLLRNLELTGMGVEHNPDAVSLAIRNAGLHGLGGRVSFMQDDASRYLEHANESFTLITANPPYIPADDLARLAPEIRGFEPMDSLDGGPDGLDFYRTVLPLLPSRLAAGGVVAMEIGAGQGEAVSAMMRAAGLVDVAVHTDYAGFERAVIACAS